MYVAASENMYEEAAKTARRRRRTPPRQGRLDVLAEGWHTRIRTCSSARDLLTELSERPLARQGLENLGVHAPQVCH